MMPVTVPRYRGNRLLVVVDELRQARADLKDAKRREDDAKAELLSGLGKRPALQVGETIVRARQVETAPGTLVTAAMVGSRVGGRRGYVVLELVGPGDDEATGEATGAVSS